MSSTKRSPSVNPATRTVDEPRDKIEEKDHHDMTIFGGEQPSERYGDPCLDAALQSQIGHKLRIMFDQVANAPIPDKFLDLLEKLNSGEKLK